MNKNHVITILVLVIVGLLVSSYFTYTSNADNLTQSYQAGYSKGITEGAGRGYNIRDPSYQEALAFIAQDQTDKNNYNVDSFDCYDYTSLFCNNAFNVGYRCGSVLIAFPNDKAHAIACFNTTDKGLVFVEPQSDEIVNLEIGQQYWDRAVYEAPSYSDIVTDYQIIW